MYLPKEAAAHPSSKGSSWLFQWHLLIDTDSFILFPFYSAHTGGILGIESFQAGIVIRKDML